MNGAQLSEIEIHRKARGIVAGLTEIPGVDAMMVINQAQSIILRESLAITPPPVSAVFPFNPNLIRRGLVSKIEADPELKAFIHSLPVYGTAGGISEMCIERFGNERAPGRNSVGRYLQKLSKRYPQEKINE